MQRLDSILKNVMRKFLCEFLIKNILSISVQNTRPSVRIQQEEKNVSAGRLC